MSDSIGKVQLDLETNYGPFQQQLNGIAGKSTNMVKTAFLGLGKVFAGVFAVKTLVNFGKASINLASDLQEVQNVVDVVFGESANQINNFAKTAMTQYGLSELAAKRYSSTMGAMLKSMRLSQNAVLGMSQSITALAGDMASFYNLDSDDAFNKIRSGISGETEPLKQLGINMSVANMEAFALSQGITKSYQSMTQAEQALLRYNYLLSTTADAQGDFARTSDSWANQTRILSEQWKSFSATLGSTFIIALTPVVKMLNWFMAKLQIAASYFKAFIEAITGIKAESNSVSSGLGGIADSATEAGDATVEAANKASKALAGFDRLNVLSSGADGGGSSGSGMGGDFSIPDFDVGASAAEAATDSMMSKLGDFKKKLEELAKWRGFDKLWQGIKDGVKKVDFSALKTNFTSIVRSLIPIAQSYFTGLVAVLEGEMELVGSLLGGMVSLSSKTIEIATGGIAQFLTSQRGVISAWIEETSLKMSTGFSNLSFSADTLFASLWEALDANQLNIEESIAECLTVVSNMGTTVGTIFSDMWVGLTEGIANFLSENRPLLGEFFDGLVENSLNAADVITTSTGDIFKSLNSWWKNDGKRIWNEVVEVFFDLVEWVLKLWNSVIKPVIDYLSKALSDLWAAHLKPLWDRFLEFITSLWNAIKAIWDFIKPFVFWLIDSVGPGIVKVFKDIIDTFKNVAANIIDSVKGVITALKGILDFITGVFTGNWKKAWEGIKTFFKGLWDSLVGVVKAPINLIIGCINTMVSGIVAAVNVAIKALNKLSFTVPDWVPGIGGKKWGFNIKELTGSKIPYLARGGIIDQPTLAMVGEQGKEAVVPLENTAFADSIANAILRVLAPLFANGNNIGNNADGSTVIVLKIGEYELGRITVGAINKYHNVIGKVELEV